ncbi:MAG: LytTR family transcriptional regulator DNA-binding domain-containing protein [Bacteroidetes bacterium]|nr:LytTR family transcriptional regulator DNA-binding domain-containing protein [Bacteroidota bacterium]
MVNIRNVKNVSGSSQGYRLIFDHVEESVPVSRRASTTVKSLLSRIHGR